MFSCAAASWNCGYSAAETTSTTHGWIASAKCARSTATEDFSAATAVSWTGSIGKQSIPFLVHG